MTMDDIKLVVLAEYNAPMAAELAKTILDSAGIYSSIRNEYMSSIYPTGVAPAQLVVKQEDFEAAQILVRDAR